MNNKAQQIWSLMAGKGISLVLRLLFFVLFIQIVGASVAHAQSELTVYSASSKLKLINIPNDTRWSVVENQIDWLLVRFAQPLVPVWVSADYVNINQEQASVRVARLNARTEPFRQAPVLGVVTSGYSAKVLARSNNFIQILSPIDWVFALRETDLKALESSSPSLQKNTAGAWVLGEATTSAKPEAATSIKEEISAPVTESETVDNYAVEQPHRIAPGDTISLLVFGEPELSASNVRIPQSGAVSFPLIGSTDVQGKTTSEIEQLVAAKLSGGYVKNPQLSVTIDGYRPIFIRGAIALTGDFPFTEGLTIVKAISLAGGTKNSAKTNGVSILRDGVMVHEGISAESQIEVHSGDIISIEEELGVGDESTAYVYLHGEVQSPGSYEFRRGLTVEKAIVLAGGFSLRASKRKISVSRIVEGQLEPEKLKRVELYLPVQPGDIINVGASWF